MHSKPFIYKFVFVINPIVLHAPFICPLKTSKNLKVFWCFQGVHEGCIGKNWVKLFVIKSRVLKVEIRLNKKKLINPNQFLIDFSTCFTETYLRETIATSEMTSFVALVRSFWLVANVTKNSITWVARGLHLPLDHHNFF